MEVPQGVATALRVLGVLLIIFAIVDVVLARVFAIDLTGVTWSPIAAGIAGSVLLRFFTAAES